VEASSRRISGDRGPGWRAGVNYLNHGNRVRPGKEQPYRGQLMLAGQRGGAGHLDH